MKRAVALALIAALAGSCATGPRDSEGHPRTALDRSIGQCVATMAISTIAGALLGAAINRRNGAATGAAIGAGAGAVQCAIIIALNNEQDRERIRQAEQAALVAGRSSTTTYLGSDGKQSTIQTRIAAAPLPASLVGVTTGLTARASASPGLSAPAAPSMSTAGGETIVGPCRRVQQTITVADQGTASLPEEYSCRTAQGDYTTISEKPTS